MAKYKGGSAYERLMSRTAKTETCWLWLGCRTRFGHGQIGGFKNGVKAVLPTHRVSWEHHNGPIPEGMCVLHKCDVPNCVNPEHLFIGTRTDNSNDKLRKGRAARGFQLPHTKLPDEVVAWIRAMPRTVSKVRIAAALGVSTQTVHDILAERRRVEPKITDEMRRQTYQTTQQLIAARS